MMVIPQHTHVHIFTQRRKRIRHTNVPRGYQQLAPFVRDRVFESCACVLWERPKRVSVHVYHPSGQFEHGSGHRKLIFLLLLFILLPVCILTCLCIISHLSLSCTLMGSRDTKRRREDYDRNRQESEMRCVCVSGHIERGMYSVWITGDWKRERERGW